MSTGLFLAALDTYVVVTVLPRMMFDLALPLDRIERATPIISGFLVGYIVTMPLTGALSDVYGRGRVYLASLAVFAIGSILTATAGLTSFPSESLGGLPWLVAGRVLQGVGGGAMVPVALALAADLFPAGSRALPLGLVAAVQESGSVMGPLYGATVAAAASGFGGWRAIFWINMPLTVLCAIGLLLAERAGDSRPRSSAVAPKVDWTAAGLLGAGLALLVLALYPDDPSRHAVGSLFIPMGVAALAALAGYGWRQSRQAEPLIPPVLLRNRAFIGANATNLLVGAVLIVALVDVPIVARRRSLFGLPDATITLAFCGFGFGLVIAPVAAAILDRARDREHGLASSLVVLARSMGMLLGLSALAAFGIRRFYELFNQAPVPVDGSAAATAAALQARFSSALLEEYHEVFLIAAGICVLAGAIALATISGGGRRTATVATS